MRGRVIAIGDIHGCADEFEAMLDHLNPRHADRLVLLGDLVNRGPDSARVVRLARRHAHVSLLGNHELRLLKFRKTRDESHLKRGDAETLAHLDRKAWSYLENMPLTYEDRRSGTVFVHGGFLPGQPWYRQPARIVTRVQVVDSSGEPRKRSEAPGAPHWSTLWNGPPFVVYGHTSRPEVARTKWTLGIDTACAAGGHLTAYILPSREIFQIKARKVYYAAG